MEHQLLLDNFKQFISLSQGEEQTALGYSIERSFKRGGFLTVEKEVNRYTNFIVKGSCRVFYIDTNGSEHVIQLGIRNWWTGDFSSFITQQPGMMYTEALEPTTVLSFSYDDLELLFEKVPKMERFFRLIIQKAYAAFQKRILQSMSMDAEQRYITFSTAYPAIDLQVSQKHIASYLGMSPEFLSTIKKRIVQKKRNHNKTL
jgi:CRP-like cAMP-binding protein